MTTIRFFFLAIIFSVTSSGFGDDGDAVRNIVSKTSPWMVRIDTIGGLEKVAGEFANEGTGSGLLLDRDGYVITSAFHFLHDPASILLRFADGSKKVAKKCATDTNRMLTLLKVDGFDGSFLPEPLPVTTKESVKVGDRVVGVGVALSATEPNIATGIISGMNRIWGKAIQTDVAVGPNNYGGPLFDMQGRLLGILAPLSMTSTAVTAGADMYDAGIGFAVPMEDIAKILPLLKEGKDLAPGVVGIGFKENRTFIGDAVIDTIQPDSPVAGAGLKEGDKIIAIDGKPIGSALELSMNLRARYVDEEIRLTYQRDGVEETVTLKTIPVPKKEEEEKGEKDEKKPVPKKP